MTRSDMRAMSGKKPASTGSGVQESAPLRSQAFKKPGRLDFLVNSWGLFGRLGFGWMIMPRRRLRMRLSVKPGSAIAIRLPLRTAGEAPIAGAAVLTRAFYGQAGNRIIEAAPSLPELTQLTAFPWRDAPIDQDDPRDWQIIKVPNVAYKMELEVQRRPGTGIGKIQIARQWRVIDRGTGLAGIDGLTRRLRNAQSEGDFIAGGQVLAEIGGLWQDPAIFKARAALDAAQALAKQHYLLDLGGIRACDRPLDKTDDIPINLVPSFLPVLGEDASLVDLEHATVILALGVCERGVPIIDVPDGEELLLRLVMAMSIAHQLGATVRLNNFTPRTLSLGAWLHFDSLESFLTASTAGKRVVVASG